MPTQYANIINYKPHVVACRTLNNILTCVMIYCYCCHCLFYCVTTVKVSQKCAVKWDTISLLQFIGGRWDNLLSTRMDTFVGISEYNRKC